MTTRSPRMLAQAEIADSLVLSEIRSARSVLHPRCSDKWRSDFRARILDGVPRVNLGKRPRADSGQESAAIAECLRFSHNARELFTLSCDLTSQSPCGRKCGMKNTGERSLHLIDIENLTGSPNPSREDVRWYQLAYEALHVGPVDHVVVACSHRAAPNVRFGWQQGRHLWRSGNNGADLALLDVIAQERVEECFNFVVLASGDGIFADAVARLGAQGVDVTVVSRPESLSLSLMLAASRHILFPYPPTELDRLGTPA